MAVYTNISADELETFLGGFDLGDPVSLDGIAEGIENTNYQLRTSSGLYVLTLYEKRVDEADLPFFLGLIAYLAATGFPCPAPVADRTGKVLQHLAGRPAAIVNFATGSSPRKITCYHCRKVGTALAQLHGAARGFPIARTNKLGLNTWRQHVDTLRSDAENIRPGLGAWLTEELFALEAAWPKDLPMGVIHADLFPDNVFFEGGEISGVIDFYFACKDALAFDLAICLNAWCFRDGIFDAEKGEALISGYEQERRLDESEHYALPFLARGAAMRFLTTRLHDWFHAPTNVLARRKNPLELLPVIEFHRDVSDSSAYRIG